jgi:hypothetical protein
VNAAAAVGTQAIAFADKDETTLNFELAEISSDFSQQGTIQVRNDGATPVDFNVAEERPQGSPHTLTLSSSHITVPAHSQGSVDVTLKVPAATAGDSSSFRDVAGLVTFTPTTATSNHGYTLRVPFYLVPRVSSNLDAKLSLKHNATQGVVALTNQGSPIPATADFYAWGLQDQKNNSVGGQLDLHAAGVQSVPDGAGGQVLVFAINTYKAWNTPETQEFDVLIDVDGDGVPDFDVFSGDLGRVLAGAANGQMVAFILNLKTGDLAADFLADARNNSSTILLPVEAADIGVPATNPRFSYTVQSFDLNSNDTDAFSQTASFNAYQSAVSTGDFEVVNPNAAIGVTVSVNPAEFAVTPPLGVMIVSEDNKNGPQQVELLNIKQ